MKGSDGGACPTRAPNGMSVRWRALAEGLGHLDFFACDVLRAVADAAFGGGDEVGEFHDGRAVFAEVFEAGDHLRARDVEAEDVPEGAADEGDVLTGEAVAAEADEVDAVDFVAAANDAVRS